MEGKRIPIINMSVNDAVEAVRRKIFQRLEEKGHHSYASTHEALGIINEEHHELVEAVQANDPERFENECLDIAVACVFAIACKRAGALDW